MKADDYQVGGDHYRRGKIQPWAAMEDWMTPEEFKGFLRGCAIKRLQRLGEKDDTLVELKKTHHEIAKLIEVIEGERAAATSCNAKDDSDVVFARAYVQRAIADKSVREEYERTGKLKFEPD